MWRTGKVSPSIRRNSSSVAWRLSAGEWNLPADVVTPDPTAGETYDELYGLYRGLYPATRGAAHVLAALSRRMA